MKKIALLAICLALLGACPTLAVTVDFEAPTYVGQATTAGSISPPVRATAPTSLIADDLSSSQDGWYESWGNHFDVHTYEGAAVSFEETRMTVHPEGGHQQWSTPPNPEGGEQFIALGCGNFLRDTDAHGNSGGSNKKHLGTEVGGKVVQFSMQYCNAYEYDYGGYMSTAYVQDDQDGTLGSVTGIYAREGSEPIGNQTGPWAPAFWLYNADGERLETRPGDTGGFMPGTTFYGVDGFDNLPMETWFELGVTADLDPSSPMYNRIVEVRSRNMITCEEWIIQNPQVMWDDPDDSPDMGPTLVSELYIGGGQNSDLIPDTLGVYNVGWGTVAAFDNFELDGSTTLEWQGNNGTWGDTNWDNYTAVPVGPVAGNRMVIDATTDVDGNITGPSLVTVDADYVDNGGSGNGPSATVFVGQVGDEDNGAKLVIASDVTLEIKHGYVKAFEFGKVAIENGATIDTCGALIEVDGRMIFGVQGNATDGTLENGLLHASKQLTIDEYENAGTIYGGADALNVDWLPGEDVGSMFGGVYRVAEYSGDTLAPGGTMTNSEGNIGTGYIKSVAYDVDVNGDGTVYGVEVELHAQGNGDTDLDADVDGDDLATFGLAWAPSGTDKTWFDGDFDFDGDIDGDDLAALGLAWAPSGISFPAGDVAVTAVPEPGTIVMLLVAAAGLLIYRKRR